MLVIKKLSGDRLRSKLVLTIMCGLVLFFPLFKGGNYPGAMSVFIFSTGLVFLLSITELLYERDKYWVLVWGVFSVAILFHVFIYPFFFVNERFFIDGLSSQVGVELNSKSSSKIRMLEVWSFFTSMWLFAWRVSLLNLKQLGLLLTVLFMASSFQVLFGLERFISDASNILGLWTKEFYLDDATGTFVNRNHFAGMLAITSPLILSALLMPKPLILPSLSQSYRVILSLLYLMLLILALVSSHSRMGGVAAILGLIVCYFFNWQIRNRSSHKMNILKVISVVSFLILFSVWFGLGDILQRYTELADGNSRFDVWGALFTKIPTVVWFFGAGPGAFESIFQIIKPSNFSVRFIYAHNDYLEFVFEFGVLLSCFIGVAVFIWVKNFYRFFKFGGYLKAGVYGAISAVSVHSLVDFNLQVPASALCFWLCIGVLVNKEIVFDVEGSPQSPRSSRKRPRFRLPRNKREWLNYLKSD